MSPPIHDYPLPFLAAVRWSRWVKQGERWYKATAEHVISFCPGEGHLFGKEPDGTPERLGPLGPAAPPLADDWRRLPYRSE